MSNKIREEIEKIEIPKELKERSKLGIKKAKLEKEITKKNKFQLKNYKVTSGLIAALLLITISVSPNVKAQETFWSSLLWVKEVTNLPIYIPEKWLPSEEELTHYYYEVTTTDKGYSMNLYWGEDSIPFEKAKNPQIPLSESQYVGTISGVKVQNPKLEDLPPLKTNEEITLASGTKAQGDVVGLRWKDGKWTFDVVGYNAMKYANELEQIEKNGLREINKGQIRVIVGNGVTTHISWIENNNKYDLQVKGDVNEAVKIFKKMPQFEKGIK